MQICNTDRLHARLNMGGRDVYSFFVENASDIRDVVTMAYSYVPEVRGMAVLYVRNMTRGECMKKRIRFGGKGLLTGIKALS